MQCQRATGMARATSGVCFCALHAWHLSPQARMPDTVREGLYLWMAAAGAACLHSHPLPRPPDVPYFSIVAFLQSRFWSCDVEKLHAAVARSTFSSQNRKKLMVSDHFLKLRCGKIARRCGEKHIFNQNAPLATGSDQFLKLGCGKSARRCSETHICKSKC